MRRRTATAATLALLLLAPATALGAESASVTGGLLTYTSAPGTVDTVEVRDGLAGFIGVEDTTTSFTDRGPDCDLILGLVWCPGVTAASVSTLDADDTVVVDADVPVTVDPGPGSDSVTGGPGDDTIAARDGAVDTIECGPGTDTAVVDAGDVVSGCELTELPAPPAPVAPATDAPLPAPPPAEAPPSDAPPSGAPPAIASPPLGVLPAAFTATEVRVSADGVASFELACPATEVAGCVGAVYLDPAPARKRRARALAARRGRYGKARFRAPAGKKTRVRMSLSSSARRALGLPRGRAARAARRGRVRAVATVVQRGRRPSRSFVVLKR